MIADVERRDQSENVTGGLDVAVGAERGIAVAVATKISAGNTVAGVAQRWSEEAIPGSQVPHSRYKHDERPVTGDVVGDASFRAVEVDGGWHRGQRGRGHGIVSGSSVEIRVSQRS
jgi:hypothetical protein